MSDFEKGNPRIETFLDKDWMLGAILLRYEIKGVKESTNKPGEFEVVTVLVMQSRAKTELTEQGTYRAHKNFSGDKWWISRI